MSEKVKLIIEIPKADYLAFSELSEKEKVNELSYYERIVANGIPLDDVIAEIEKHQFSREYCCDHNIDTAIDMGMVRIILDNIGKAESEVKPNDSKGT